MVEGSRFVEYTRIGLQGEHLPQVASSATPPISILVVFSIALSDRLCQNEYVMNDEEVSVIVDYPHIG